MFHKLYKHYLLLICIVVVAGTGYAQNTQNFSTKSNRENAPYTRFGIGEFRNGINPLMKGMGGITSSYNNPFAINASNPASYASLLLTTYEGSLQASTRTIHSGNEKFKTGMATINHMNIGMPVGKHAGMSFGFMPLTHIYYKLSDTSVIPLYGNSVRTFYGDGSLSYAYVGFAGKYKGFSAGFNFGYIFGSTVYSSLLESIDNTQNVNDAQFSKVVKSGGIYWKGGLQYNGKIGSNLLLGAGATFAVNQDIKSKLDEFWMSYNYSGGDTAYSRLTQQGTLTMPLMYSAGLQIADSNKWLIGVDFSAANWSNYQGLGRVDSVGDVSYKIAAGGEYTPDATALRKYFSRVTYRLGFYYGQDYVYVRNTPINYYAVTFGFGLPFKRYTDRVNTAFEIGRRGSETNGLFRENFVKATIGITLNDKWFIKRKYD
ncbi:MAG: hypothetical protein H6550_10280 [Chitinophagales bacterium]|nr:hypothetical protein [Chitinophagales bacterium]